MIFLKCGIPSNEKKMAVSLSGVILSIYTYRLGFHVSRKPGLHKVIAREAKQSASLF
jgi:hypothetical protein